MEQCSAFQFYEKEIDSHANMRHIAHDSEGMIYEIEGVDGVGTVEVLTVFPNVFLQFHSFHCKSFCLPQTGEVSRGLKINFCAEGRAEVRMSDNMCLFMEPGTLSLDVRTAQDVFQFPCGHYHGVELFLHQDCMERELPEVWNTLGIDPKKIQSRFCKENESYAIYADDRFRELFLAMLDAPPDCKKQYLQVKTMELLLLLQNTAMPDKSNTGTMMTMGQVEIAKQIRKIITKDLGQHYTIESFTETFGVSASSIKNYFQGVYGKNISTYLREARMSSAALALKDSTRTVAEIAASVGYENASKFSAAFKNFFGESPLEYRRQSRCGI